MKTIYSLFFFYFTSILLAIQCQEWAPIGAEWRYRSELSPTNEVWYELTRVEKDTIVAGQQCRKYVVYKDNPNQGEPIFKYAGFTFERNDSVFFWHQDDFYLRYDFSALPGDTLIIPTPGFGNEPGTTDSFMVVLDSIKTVLIGLSQTPLQKYYTHSIYGTLDYQDNGYYRIIGSYSTWGGLTSDGVALGHIYMDLRCYSDENIDIFGIDMSCSFPNAVDGLADEFSIHLFPNPTSGLITIELPDSNKGFVLQFFDLLGRAKGSFNVHSSRNKIDISYLKKGLYVYHLYSNASILTQGKVIIE